MNLHVPYMLRSSLSGWVTGGFSRRAELHGVSYFSWAKLVVDAEHEVILIKNKQKEELSSEMECTASLIILSARSWKQFA
jgi:hypothetical protein